MYRLRKKNPPFGTVEAPLWEYTYSEQAKVVDGICEVRLPTTKDYLLKIGYEEVLEDELVSVGAPAEGPVPESRTGQYPVQEAIAPPGPSNSSKKNKKKKRW